MSRCLKKHDFVYQKTNDCVILLTPGGGLSLIDSVALFLQTLSLAIRTSHVFAVISTSGVLYVNSIPSKNTDT